MGVHREPEPRAEQVVDRTGDGDLVGAGDQLEPKRAQVVVVIPTLDCRLGHAFDAEQGGHQVAVVGDGHGQFPGAVASRARHPKIASAAQAERSEERDAAVGLEHREVESAMSRMPSLRAASISSLTGIRS